MKDGRESKCLCFSAFIVEGGFCPIWEESSSNIGRGFKYQVAPKGRCTLLIMFMPDCKATPFSHEKIKQNIFG